MNSHSPASSPNFTPPVSAIGHPSPHPSSLGNDSSSATISDGSYDVQKESGQGMTIDTLPDNVLLDIFDSFLKDNNRRVPLWNWLKLAHVCQRWRQIVIGSPRRLDLGIYCRDGTPVREILDGWLPIPISIHYDHDEMTLDDEDSIFAALEHHGRMHQIDLCLAGQRFKKVVTVMQESLPALTHLTFCGGEVRKDEDEDNYDNEGLDRADNGYEDEDEDEDDKGPYALPSGFLGGSAPCLQYIHLDSIAFPALPTLLSSTIDLVHLKLCDIPQDGYISPEAMVACLGALPRLEYLSISYSDSVTHLDRILLAPVTRTLIPALAKIRLRGDTKYLEEFFSRIDAPQVKSIDVELFDFQIAQLFEFINRSQHPDITLSRHADVAFSPSFDEYAYFEMNLRPDPYYKGCIYVSILRQGDVGRRLSRMAQLLSQQSVLLSRVVHLNLTDFKADEYGHSHEWLYLLRQFSAVRTLHSSRKAARAVAFALEGIARETVTEVLPVLDLIYLDGQRVKSIEKFLTARRCSGHPVTVINTKAEFDDKVKSYVIQ